MNNNCFVMFSMISCFESDMSLYEEPSTENESIAVACDDGCV
ncbi:hypothetical protein HanLR1_Chr02g0054471 [Helianthus annuus]|nr:hypothetical protein HanLR1_Chr02g0054471 [Helianthus annuus]